MIDFDEISRSLLIREPYFGHLLVGTTRIQQSDRATSISLLPFGHVIAVCIGSMWNALSTKQKVACIKHELLHLSLKHPLRAHAFGASATWSVACDLVVNQHLDTLDLPESITAQELNLPLNLTADEYYQRLLPMVDALCAGGQCTGGDSLAAALARCAGEWQNFCALSSGERSVMETNVAGLIEMTVRRARSRSWGRDSGSLHELLERSIKPPQFPWRRMLRLFGTSSERTYLKNTIARPSKRYGTTPGIKIKRRTNLGVAVDTSGSLLSADCAEFFVEIHAMWRRGAIITVLEADTRVTREYRYRGTPPSTISGRGGTDFNAAIERANQLNVDGLLYFTDGHATIPHVPARMPLLWVLSAAGNTVEEMHAFPGRKLKIHV